LNGSDTCADVAELCVAIETSQSITSGSNLSFGRVTDEMGWTVLIEIEMGD
jgi:hypothetical protein